jgi:hypothetical protein
MKTDKVLTAVDAFGEAEINSAVQALPASFFSRMSRYSHIVHPHLFQGKPDGIPGFRPEV